MAETKPEAVAAKATASAKKTDTTPAARTDAARQAETDRPATLTAPQPTGQDAAAANPAGVAIRDAARAAETEQLRQRRDELRELIGDAPSLEVLRAEVNALEQAAARAGVTRTARWTMSAGVAADLETRGYATDPATGDAYVRDGDRVTVTSRSGEVRTVDMPAPSGAGEAKPAETK